MIKDKINLFQDPRIAVEKFERKTEPESTQEEIREHDEIENKIFEALLGEPKVVPSWSDTERLKIADPDPQDEQPPLYHPDTTHPRKAVFYLGTICQKCRCSECKCPDQSNKGKYEIF